MERDGETCVGADDWLGKEKKEGVEQPGTFERNNVKVKYWTRRKPVV